MSANQEDQNSTPSPNQNSDSNSTGIFHLFIELFRAIKNFMVELLDIREGTDIPETIEKIKEGIPVKSHTAWILIFSIFIASIGLNVSSTAVVIGAMLVSPLMGPILGVGLAVGTNDIDTLRKSFKNLGVMVGLSILSSFLFFSIPIFQEATPELMARTKPDIRDVLIAIAGGLALIVALSRKKELITTIAGIAIATALMPPLCTAGYGLAVGNLSYFGGAIFLFTINALFIAIATFAVIKFLNFPVVKYLDSESRKRISQFISLISFVVIAFSVYQFYNLFQENRYVQNAHKIIRDLQSETGVGIVQTKIDTKTKNIEIIVLGKNLSQSEIKTWNDKMQDYDLDGSTLEINQDTQAEKLMDKLQSLENLYTQNQNFLTLKEETIQEKDLKIRQLSGLIDYYKSQTIPFDEVAREAKIFNPGIEQISYARRVSTNFETANDTLTVFNVNWSDEAPPSEVEKARLREWLKARCKLDTVVLD